MKQSKLQSVRRRIKQGSRALPKQGEFLSLAGNQGNPDSLKRRMRYQMDKVFAKGPGAQFLLLLILTTAVIAIGGLGYFIGLFSEANKNVGGIPKDWGMGFWDTLWWSLNMVLDAGAFAGNYGATPHIVILSFFVTLMGMVIFGIFIGFVTTTVEDRLEVLRRGESEVLETGHILALGFSRKLFAVLNLLSEVEKEAAFVVLADQDIDEMRQQMRLHLAAGMKNTIILRKGDPSSLHELERVSFTKAKSIILLAQEDVDEGVNPDIDVIKTLLLLDAYEGWGPKKPHIVAEILNHENQDVAQLAGGPETPLVATGDLVSKLLVQTSRQPGLSRVYEDMFAFEGSELYILHVPEAEGRTMEDVLCRMPPAVPIGVAWTEQVDGKSKLITSLNTPADRVIAKGESLILLAEDENVTFDTNGETYRCSKRQLVKQTEAAKERVLILGYSPSLPAVLGQFNEYMAAGTPVTVISGLEEEELREHLEEELDQPLDKLELTVLTGDYLRKHVAEPLLTPDLTCLVLMADASFNEHDPDGRTLMAAVLLRELAAEGKFGVGTQLVAEILNPDNRALLQLTNIFDILVSPEITSMLLAQLSRQPALNDVFVDMLDAGGVEVYMKPVSRYLPLGQEFNFKDVLHACLMASEMALGVLLREESGGPFEVFNNPAKDTVFTFGPHDRIIVLAEDLYDNLDEDGG